MTKLEKSAEIEMMDHDGHSFSLNIITQHQQADGMRCVLRLLAHPRFRPFRRFQLRLAGLRAAGGDLHCMGKPVADLTFVLSLSNHFQVKHA